MTPALSTYHLHVWLNRECVTTDMAWCPGAFLRLCRDFRDAHVLYRLCLLWLQLRDDGTHPSHPVWLDETGQPHLQLKSSDAYVFAYISQSTASRLMRRLEERGLVTSQQPEGKKGGLFVALNTQEVTRVLSTDAAQSRHD